MTAAYQIYGVVVDKNGEKERRYYGDCDSMESVTAACDTLLNVVSVDYAYAKQIGVGTVFYKESPNYQFRGRPDQPVGHFPPHLLE